MAPPLSTDAKRLRTVVIAFPVLVVTSAILYRRAFMGEEQRRIPRPQEVLRPEAGQDSILHHGKALGGAPWVRQGDEEQRR
ncbi:hypothetical protein CC85DRAFT_283015 [Cutaneotrichosporon oleaginosum]|uniref:Uncharacterized protein n=1 Tax=Cutaneotrichosporon oleaginosum TaxID=879819 RepID=A0A0J0XVL1_9TREE|nr:uncharacterized protein CC85DRAFT_283015 [Cutaneotrichosporon oleaginosum]KLT45101.1 hypothetical protein CC85DRAFT_283015 [Cutaneotrichosporon oleaginosum]TXT09782.1 hypothetical protein COLE_03716 [Cutaneotrichosporon oleaginosum]